MSSFLTFVYIFYIGSSLGWVLELFFRRIVHKKWINPGFLVGPYLPIYGFGLCALTYSFFLFYNSTLSPFFIIILMGTLMTIIELIGGLIFQKEGIKLWDYSDRFANYKGIICPLFSFIWTVLGGVYYYFIAPRMVRALEWFSNNLSFSFILGIFFGIIIPYFWTYGKYTLKEKEFNEVDNVIFSCLSYLDFECQNKTLEEAAAIYFKKNPNKGIKYNIAALRNAIRVLENCIKENRYKNIKIMNYKKVYTKKTQFQAVSFLLDTDLV